MSWRKEAFDNVIAEVSAGSERIPQSEFLTEGSYAIVDQGTELVAGYTNDPDRLCRAELPVIVFGDHTRNVKYIDFPFCIGADGVKVLRPRLAAEVKYLYYYLRQLYITEAGYERHFKYLRRSTILLPPLPEQLRIVEILDKADALQAKRRAALAQLDTLTQSIFLDMFGDPARNDRGWPQRKLRELGIVQTGATPPSSRPGMFGGDIPFITPGDLESGAQVKRTLTEAGANEAVTVREGAALVCCIGATIGKIGKASVRSAFNQQINAVEWGSEVEPDYGYAVLSFLRPTIVAWGASTTLPILKKSTFEQIEIPVPPVQVQKVFAQRFARIANLRRTNTASLKRMAELFASLQHRAFRGEL